MNQVVPEGTVETWQAAYQEVPSGCKRYQVVSGSVEAWQTWAQEVQRSEEDRRDTRWFRAL